MFYDHMISFSDVTGLRNVNNAINVKKDLTDIERS